MELSLEMKRGVDYIGVLRREIREECGVEIEVGEPVIRAGEMLRDRLVRPRPGPTGADRDQPREPRELR